MVKKVFMEEKAKTSVRVCVCVTLGVTRSLLFFKAGCPGSCELSLD